MGSSKDVSGARVCLLCAVRSARCLKLRAGLGNSFSGRVQNSSFLDSGLQMIFYRSRFPEFGVGLKRYSVPNLMIDFQKKFRTIRCHYAFIWYFTI